MLDYFLILGNAGFPRLGAAGAGYATAIGTAIAAIFGIWRVFSDREKFAYRLNSSWHWDRDLMGRFIRFGVPAGMQWALEGLAFSIFLIFIGRMLEGSAALSASSIVVTLMMLSVLPALGMAQAAAVLMGQYIGEKRPADAQSAVWASWQVTVLYILAVGVTFVLVPGFYIRWFENRDNPEIWHKVLQMASYLLIFVAIFTTSDSINLIFSFALKGAGDTRFVTMVALLLPWPLMVLPTYLLSDQPGGVYWAWGAATVYSLVQATIFWRRFVGGKWKQMSVIS
jgi:MATE family multidrug resistance protein